MTCEVMSSWKLDFLFLWSGHHPVEFALLWFPVRFLNLGSGPIYILFMQRRGAISRSESAGLLLLLSGAIMGCFKWFVIMELNFVLDAVTQAYCEQLCCYSHCGLFEAGVHTHTRRPHYLHSQVTLQNQCG